MGVSGYKNKADLEDTKFNVKETNHEKRGFFYRSKKPNGVKLGLFLGR
jgi:hypothetical protein